MTITFGPFDAGAGASIAEGFWRDSMARFWFSDGIIRGERNEGAVAQDSGGASMNVEVATLRAAIRGHYMDSDAVVTKTLSTAHATLARIDRIVLRADFSANTMTVEVLTGTAAASPTAPALTQSSTVWEISLAQCSVPAADTTIANAQITDERKFAQAIESVQGLDVTSATTVAPHTFTESFHKVTGTTTIRNLPSGTHKGQKVVLYFTSALTIENNGGGSGNLRVGGSDISVVADEVCTFIWDGTVWWIVARTGSAALIYRKASIKDVVSTASATDLFNGEITIGAGAMSTNKTVRIFAAGDYLNADGAARTVTIDLLLGGTSIWTSILNAGLINTGSRRGWMMEAWINNTGATNAQFTNGFFVWGQEGVGDFDTLEDTTAQLDSADYRITPFSLATVTAVDTTAARALVLNCTHSASSANLSMRLKSALVEVI